MTKYHYQAVRVEVGSEGVAHVHLHRPSKMASFHEHVVSDIKNVFEEISRDSDVRAVVLSSPHHLAMGLDLTEAIQEAHKANPDSARAAYKIRGHIKQLQAAYSAIEKCTKPVIAAIHGGCFSAAIDLITACDIRYCSRDTFFCLKEVNIGLPADLGTIQRLPKIIGNNSLVRELCFTGRNMYAHEALECGLVSKVAVEGHEAVLSEAFKTAKAIASKSPVAILSTKHLLNYSRDHSVAESLDYAATWSQAMSNTKDTALSFEAFENDKPPRYSKL